MTKTRNFSRAADNLFVTSAAVSARIKLLESQLGVRLFIRHRGHMQLTNEGERLVPLAENMMHTWARTLQELSMEPSLATRLHLGATSSMWLFSLGEKLVGIRQEIPELALQVEAHSNETLSRLLIDKTLDMVVISDPPSGADFHSMKIGELKLVLASRDATDVETAFNEGYIYVDWGTAFSMFHARKFGELVRPTLHVNVSSIAVTAIEAAGGAAYLPRTFIESNPVLTEVPDSPIFNRPIYVCYQAQHHNLDLIERVAGILEGTDI